MFPGMLSRRRPRLVLRELDIDHSFCDSCDIVHVRRLRRISPSPATMSALSPSSSRVPLFPSQPAHWHVCTVLRACSAHSSPVFLHAASQRASLRFRVGHYSTPNLDHCRHHHTPLGTCSAVHHLLSSNHRKILHLCVCVLPRLSTRIRLQARWARL